MPYKYSLAERRAMPDYDWEKEEERRLRKNARQRAWHKKNPNKAKEYHQKYHAYQVEYARKNRKRISERGRIWKENNRLRVKTKSAEYAASHRAELNARWMLRRIQKLRTSKFETLNNDAVLFYYKLSELVQRWTGVDHDVDHIIPIIGKTVSGFHVSGNLRVMPSIDNLSKGNRYTEREEKIIYDRMMGDYNRKEEA